MPHIPHLPYVFDCFQGREERHRDLLRDRMLRQAHSDRDHEQAQRLKSWSIRDRDPNYVVREADLSSRWSSSTCSTVHEELVPRPLQPRRADHFTDPPESQCGIFCATYAERDARRRPSHSGRIHYNKPSCASCQSSDAPSQHRPRGTESSHHDQVVSSQISPALWEQEVETIRSPTPEVGPRCRSRPLPAIVGRAPLKWI